MAAAFVVAAYAGGPECAKAKAACAAKEKAACAAKSQTACADKAACCPMAGAKKQVAKKHLPSPKAAGEAGR